MRLLRMPFLFRFCGLLAFTVSLVNSVFDLLLFGALPLSGVETTVSALQNVPYDLVRLGASSFILLPLWLLGLWPMVVALRPAGRLGLVAIILFAYAFALMPFYHGIYAVYATVYQILPEMTTETLHSAQTGVERVMELRWFLSMAIAVPLACGTLLFWIIVLTRRSHFPAWSVLFAPGNYMVFLPLFRGVPEPFGTWVLPPMASIQFALLFAITTIVTWNRFTDPQ